MKRPVFSLLAVIALAGLAQNSAGQDFVNTAMAGFPTQTLRVEYSSPAKLRKLSNYQSLHDRFVGPRLQQLESTLTQIGVHEDDIDELMVGWKPNDKQMDLYGFASGRFDKAGVARRATEQNFTPTPIAGQQAYCLQAGLAGTCIVVLENSFGAFGPLSDLTAILEAHSGQAPALNSDAHFMSLLGDVRKDAPIWGIALGAAVGDWFAAWLSTQNTLKLDWSKVFEKVDSLLYSIDAADNVNTEMKLNCATPEDAATLRQILDGLKMAQQLAWTAQNPGRANPYQQMNVSLNGKQIGVEVTMAYSDLQLARGIGSTTN